MKNYVSKFLKSVSYFFLSFPVTYLLLVAVFFDIPAQLCFRIMLSPFYYLLAGAVMGVGYGLREAKRWAWYLFLVTQVFIAYGNAVLLNEMSQSSQKTLAFVLAVLAQLALSYRVAREVRVPYFFPKLRWWESNPRYRVSVPAHLVRTEGRAAMAGDLLDVSEAGCFVKLRPEVPLHETLTVRFEMYGQAMECEGTVVWHAQSTVTHPRGVGIKFRGIARAQKRSLRAIARKLRRLAKFYRSSRYWMNPEEFAARYREIEQAGPVAAPAAENQELSSRP